MNTQLIKVAKRLREKRAAIGGDMARDLAGQTGIGIAAGTFAPDAAPLITTGSSIAELLGTAHGLMSHTPTIEEVQQMDNNPDRAFFPGVAGSRIWRRRRALRKLLHNKPELWNMPVSEITGAIANPIMSAAGLGMVGGEDGAALGATVGTAGNVLGSLAALITKRRSLEDQAKVENSTGRAILRHIVPGLAAYDFWKGLGATRNLSDESPEMLRAKIKDIRAKRNGPTAPHEMEQMALDALDDYMGSKGATRLL